MNIENDKSAQPVEDARVDEIVEKTKAMLRQRLGSDTSGHDWQHTERVWKTAVELQRVEGGSRCVIELSALLHDVADWKFNDGDATAGPRVADDWLRSLSVDDAVIRDVVHVIEIISFKGAGVRDEAGTLESRIVQDADRLDAMGAIGVARAFAYGGYTRQPMMDPEVPRRAHRSFEEYKAARTTTVNHFYEKLLLLRDRMNTRAARERAAPRHEFMATFLQRLQEEAGSLPDENEPPALADI